MKMNSLEFECEIGNFPFKAQRQFGKVLQRIHERDI